MSYHCSVLSPLPSSFLRDYSKEAKESPGNAKFAENPRNSDSNGRRRRFLLEIGLRRVNGFGDARQSDEHSAHCSPQKAQRRRFPPLRRPPNHTFSRFASLSEISRRIFNNLLNFLVSFSNFLTKFLVLIFFLFFIYFLWFFRFIG